MQTLVDALLKDGLVTRIPNPRHKRSKLVVLTAEGQTLFAEMRVREAELFAWLSEDLPEEDQGRMGSRLPLRDPTAT